MHAFVAFVQVWSESLGGEVISESDSADEESLHQVGEFCQSVINLG